MGVFEQGAGKLNLPAAVALMQAYEPRLSFHPPYLDTTECPYFSPYCEQPLFFSSMPLIFNATLLNAVSVTGKLASPPSWRASNVGGLHLKVMFDWPEFIWPWSGHIGMRIMVLESGKVKSCVVGCCFFFFFCIENRPFKGQRKGLFPCSSRLLFVRIRSACRFRFEFA